MAIKQRIIHEALKMSRICAKYIRVTLSNKEKGKLAGYNNNMIECITFRSCIAEYMVMFTKTKSTVMIQRPRNKMLNRA